MSQDIRAAHLNRLWKPEPLSILEKYYKKSVQAVGRAVVVDRAVLAYLDDGGNNDSTFKPFSCESEHLQFLEKWIDKITKYFDPNKSMHLPFGFGFYLLQALEEKDRKSCEAELFSWQSGAEEFESKTLLKLIAAVNKECSEAIHHGLSLAELKDNVTRNRALAEIDEAIHTLQELSNEISS